MPTLGELLNVGRVALGAGAAIFDNRDRVLLVRHGYGRHNWELPGGAAEIGESPEQTAVREVREETGLTIVPERVTGIYLESGHRLGPAMHFVLRSRREPSDAQPRIAADEIIDFAWVDPADLPRPISDFTVRRIIDATTSGSLLPLVIGERQWLQDAGMKVHSPRSPECRRMCLVPRTRSSQGGQFERVSMVALRRTLIPRKVSLKAGHVLLSEPGTRRQGDRRLGTARLYSWASK